MSVAALHLRSAVYVLQEALAEAKGRAEKAEGALCLIRSEVYKAIRVLKVRMESDGTPRDFLVEDLEHVYFADAPCPHEARLEKALEALKESVRHYEMRRDISYSSINLPVPDGEKEPDWVISSLADGGEGGKL